MKRFEKWITDSGGPRAVARMLRTESPTIYGWLRGAATPRAKTMQQIVRLSKGQVSFDDIINETSKKGKDKEVAQ